MIIVVRNGRQAERIISFGVCVGGWGIGWNKCTYILPFFQIIGNHPFLRGNSNNDSTVDISDAINTLGYLFTGTGEVTCQDAADTNDDGAVDVSDAIATLGFLFLGNPPEIKLPYPNRGLDPTSDALDFASYGK